jgi:hypothetical protein
MRPDGRKRGIYIDDMPDDLGSLLEKIFENDANLTAEELSTGEVSFTIECEEGDFDCELALNGPGEHGTRACLERLIRRFDAKRFRKWLKEASL